MIKSRAFSLPELLVILVIVSILVGIGYSNFVKWKCVFNLRSFVYELSSQIGYAKDFSRKNGVRVIVAFVKAKVPAQNWTGDSNIDPVIYIIFADRNRNGLYDKDIDDLIAFGNSRDILVFKNTLKANCFGGKGKCITFFPVGPPTIGATPVYVEFKSKNCKKVGYKLIFRSITGITGVERD